MPAWLDVGVLITGIGALLVFIGFLFGDAAVSSANSTNTYQGDFEAFFVVTGFGILLIVGGWLYRTVMIARRGRP